MTNIQQKKQLNPWYITGFCEGEATFTYSRSGFFASNLYFAVKLTKSDANLLKSLQKYFGVGKIYTVKAYAHKNNAGLTKKALYYRVSNLKDLEKIVEHFDKYPLKGQKAKQYQAWKEIFLLKKKNKRGASQKVNKELENLLKKLSTLSPRNQPWDG